MSNKQTSCQTCIKIILSPVAHSCETCVDSENYPCVGPFICDGVSSQEEIIAGIENDPAYQCDRAAGESCIKYTYFNRDSKGEAYNITRFCGKGG